ncbi:MAG TPA: 4-hydroxy-3-methylbut-2-enyl diphosphate reductase [bacterium]
MKIYYPRHIGFCFGVKRAIRMALEAAKSGDRVYSLGPLIHNRQAVEELSRKGIMPVRRYKDIKGKMVIIRSHGIHPDILQRLRRGHFTIIDATCPKVRRAQLYVEKLAQEGYYVIIVGEKDHPEVKGLLGYAKGKAGIFRDNLRLRSRKIGVVPQTTLNIEYLNHAIAKLMPSVLEMKIYNTICYETQIRIHEAIRIAEKADIMIIAGGKNSANTTRLHQICSRYKPSYHIESVKEISKKWVRRVKSVGIIAGASTPREQIRDIIRHLHKINS